ncbi:MAG: endolytic transglycosylase MltG [Actinobacteria bacterium]|nr:endolytic transglycosylase MltG [Actinomycetota bacterium]
MAWFTRNLRDSETGRISGKEIWLRARSAFAVVLSVGVLVGGAAVVSDRVDTAWTEFRTAEDYIGEGVSPVEVEIPKGAALSAIADILVENGVIKTAKAFDREAAANPDSKNISYGRYNLKTELPAKLALSMLLDPANLVRNWMTLTEGQRLDVQVQQMSKATGIPAKEFDAVLKKWKKLGLPKWAKKSADGFLFPDTYELPQEPKAAGVIKLATDQFKKVIKELDFADAAKELGVTPHQAVVIASIIEKEVFRDEDRAKVARVIYNRLEKGMTLGMDSTAIYASWREGLEKTDLYLDSPYNTRVNKGLPPTPINSPGKATLEAAVNPADGDWLYFVTVDLESGETEFSADEAGFLDSKAKFQAWCAESKENQKLCEV